MSTPEGDRRSEIINAPRPTDQFAVDTREGVADLCGRPSSPGLNVNDGVIEAIDAGLFSAQSADSAGPSVDQDDTSYPDLEPTADTPGSNDEEGLDESYSVKPSQRGSKPGLDGDGVFVGYDGNDVERPSQRGFNVSPDSDGDRGPDSKRATLARRSQRGLKLEGGWE